METAESTLIVAVCMNGKSSKVLGVLLQTDAKLRRAQLRIIRRTHLYKKQAFNTRVLVKKNIFFLTLLTHSISALSLKASSGP